jgi:hypothetical protein
MSMMSVKKEIIFFLIIFFYLSTCCAVNGKEDIEVLADNNIDLVMLENYEKTQPKRTPPVENNPEYNLYTTLELLNETVSEPLWYNTKTPSGRDILYLLPYKISSLEQGGMAFNLFFNMTDNMNVGAKSLLNTDALNKEWLSIISKELTDNNLKMSLGEAEITSLLSLFKKITLQERKLGCVLQAGFVKGPFTVQLNTSLHIAERNFWLSNSDRQSISTLINSDQGGGFSDDELVRFRYGAGDTRVKIGLNTLNKPHFQIDVGCESIIPTSRLSYAPRYKTTTNQNINNPQSFASDLVNVLRGVRDYLIAPRMGNNGHFGFGCYMEGKASILRGLVNMWTRLSYDKLLPTEEDRLVLYKQTVFKGDVAAALDAFNHGPTTDAMVQQLSKIGSDFRDQYLFPKSFLTTVYPGGVFNGVLAISTDIKKMRFSLGYDFYMQQAEKIKKIHNTNAIINQLRIEDAQASLVYQHKLFTEALYLKNFKRCELGLGLGGDVTIACQGIGKDWTAYAKLSASF